uniref:Serpentine receptor class gamma n=1 Tax=Caenorhabditis japonica TaxID=281687 RepID=A0A8R1EHW6_CAEJA
MPFTWPYTIYFLLLIIILPVYILIIICLLRLRRFYAPFQTTFYAILVQNSIADILALTLFAVQKLLCYFIPDILLSFQGPYLAA